MVEYSYLLPRPSTHHKNNYSQNMNLLVFCNVSENHCHQKLKVPLYNHVLKFSKDATISPIDFNYSQSSLVLSRKFFFDEFNS